MSLFPIFAPATAAGPGTATFVAEIGVSGSGSQTEFTFSNAAIGVAASDRLVVVIVSAKSQGQAGVVSSVTLGGSGATKAAEIAGTNPEDRLSMWYLAVSSGTTSNIVVTSPVNAYACAIVTYNINGNINSTPSATKVDNGASPNVLTISIPGLGVAIAAGSNRGGQGTSTFANITERNDFSSVTNDGDFGLTSSASDAFEDAQTNLAITHSYSAGSSTTGCGLVVAWGPPS